MTPSTNRGSCILQADNLQQDKYIVGNYQVYLYKHMNRKKNESHTTMKTNQCNLIIAEDNKNVYWKFARDAHSNKLDYNLNNIYKIILSRLIVSGTLKYILFIQDTLIHVWCRYSSTLNIFGKLLQIYAYESCYWI